MISTAIATQKGGAGKSTHCGGMASHLYYKLGRRVAILDADYPQFSLLKSRNEEVAQLRKDQAKKTRFVEQKRPAYPIVECAIKEVDQKMDQFAQQGIEYLFLDLPGTVASPGIMALIQKLDYVFVPLEQEQKSLKSSFEFINFLAKSDQTVFAAAFWNRVKKAENKKIMTQINGMMETRGIHHFNTVVEDSVVYKREGHTTSLFAPVNSNATKLYDEMFQKIKQRETVKQ